MAHTALNDSEIQEFFDEEAKIDKDVQRLAQAIRANPSGLVIYTGAGVSTSCGISDFRGPDGIWTRQKKIQQGIKQPQPQRVVQPPTTIPSPTHMAIVALQQAGYLSKLISTNCDGLHLRSGVLPERIIELHGNCYVEACPKCGRCYYRPQPVDLEGFDKSRAILTGRRCDDCSSLLRRTDVAFGQSLPDVALSSAMKASKAAKVVLVLGTSLRVQPACELPFYNRKATSCIVNLQKTPYDSKTTVRTFCQTDLFINKMMAQLGLTIPTYTDLDLCQNEDWMRRFDGYYPFRSFPDDSWFDSRDDEMALRFLQEQRKGIGIKLKTDASGQVQMERFAIDDQAGEDMDGFEIYPKKDCPHVAAVQVSNIASQLSDHLLHNGCSNCEEKEENWVCLTCAGLMCGRLKNQHMLLHALDTIDQPVPHRVCISLMDLSFWCYGCDSYVTSPVLTPIFNRVHQIKFGENALPIHDIM